MGRPPGHSLSTNRFKGPTANRSTSLCLLNRRGTLVEDDVECAVFGGLTMNRFLAAPDLNRIFEFRQDRLAKQFRAKRGSGAA